MFLVSVSLAEAQKHVGDLIENTSYNPARMEMMRQLQYYPLNGGFACINGNNRYTRALYGGYTDYRLETSDRPIFAVYKKGFCRNIQFYVNGLRLDSASYCQALYKDGCRSYVLRDPVFGNTELHLCVVMPRESESALFKINGGSKHFKLTIITGEILNPRLKRNGDMGADKPNSFEPALFQPSRKEYNYDINGETYLRLTGSDIFSLCNDKQAYEEAASAFPQSAGRITFNTPDPYFNTLGNVLVYAADGLWDGSTHTWLHGAIGWRMPLAGWRAAFCGDVIGWWNRQTEHFDAYAKSQVTTVQPIYPHPSQDSTLHLARAVKRWGTQMYSNGYICRNPGRNNQMHHYDMNLNYADELLHHFDYCPDTAYMRQMWPVLERTIDWEKRNYDPDGNGLYDGYACIWASDGLYYEGGEATHSTAYNYRLCRMAAKIARLLGMPRAEEYENRVRQILTNARAALRTPTHWAEFRDRMGLRRLHPDAAAWSYYVPIDCEMGTEQECYNDAKAVEKLPHIKVEWQTSHYDSLGINVPEPTSRDAWVCSTSDWMPYCWSINNVAPAEVMHTALACFKAGNNREGMRLMRGSVMDNMYLGKSPANFGQISYYDAARGECYRDFGDVVGIGSRAIVEGLFGIEPHGIDGICILRPGYAGVWDSVSVSTPYLSYTYKAEKSGRCHVQIRQHFPCGAMRMVLKVADGHGGFITAEGNSDEIQQLSLQLPSYEDAQSYDTLSEDDTAAHAIEYFGLGEPEPAAKLKPVDISKVWNSSVGDIYNNVYLSPRPKTTSLEIPTQGVGEWCHPLYKPEISDSVLRTMVKNDRYSVAGIPFIIPQKGKDVAYTSLWDNYPDSITVGLSGHATFAYLLLAGSTNHMQYGIDNAIVSVRYTDDSETAMPLVNPYNWCPIEQDFFVDGKAFNTLHPRPIRLCLGTGQWGRDLGSQLGISEVYGREIPGGGAVMLKMPLDGSKRLKSLTLRTLSCDVVAGLMAITLQK